MDDTSHRAHGGAAGAAGVAGVAYAEGEPHSRPVLAPPQAPLSPALPLMSAAPPLLRPSSHRPLPPAQPSPPPRLLLHPQHPPHPPTPPLLVLAPLQASLPPVSPLPVAAPALLLHPALLTSAWLPSFSPAPPLAPPPCTCWAVCMAPPPCACWAACLEPPPCACWAACLAPPPCACWAACLVPPPCACWAACVAPPPCACWAACMEMPLPCSRQPTRPVDADDARFEPPLPPIRATETSRYCYCLLLPDRRRPGGRARESAPAPWRNSSRRMCHACVSERRHIVPHPLATHARRARGGCVPPPPPRAGPTAQHVRIHARRKPACSPLLGRRLGIPGGRLAGRTRHSTGGRGTAGLGAPRQRGSLAAIPLPAAAAPHVQGAVCVASNWSRWLVPAVGPGSWSRQLASNADGRGSGSGTMGQQNVGFREHSHARAANASNSVTPAGGSPKRIRSADVSRKVPPLLAAAKPRWQVGHAGACAHVWTSGQHAGGKLPCLSIKTPRVDACA
eukprot:357767-Chlamydomonas_euryale.AAC.5